MMMFRRRFCRFTITLKLLCLLQSETRLCRCTMEGIPLPPTSCTSRPLSSSSSSSSSSSFSSRFRPGLIGHPPPVFSLLLVHLLVSASSLLLSRAFTINTGNPFALPISPSSSTTTKVTRSHPNVFPHSKSFSQLRPTISASGVGGDGDVDSSTGTKKLPPQGKKKKVRELH